MAAYTVKLRNENGETLQLYPSDDYILAGIDGITPPDATINATEMATFDGARFNSSHVMTRNILITIKIRGTDKDVRRRRVALYKYVRSKQKIRVYIANDQRDVYIDGYVENMPDAGSIFSEDQRLQLSVICPDPFFRDNASDPQIIEFSSIEASFHFPFSIEVNDPIPFSVRLSTNNRTIYNGGDTSCGMVMRVLMTGAVSAPKFFDESSDKTMTFDRSFQAGDELIVTTLRGSKSVVLRRAGEETNIINSMTYDSAWMELLPGDNIFYYSAASGADNMKLTFEFTNLYEGI